MFIQFHMFCSNFRNYQSSTKVAVSMVAPCKVIRCIPLCKLFRGIFANIIECCTTADTILIVIVTREPMNFILFTNQLDVSHS